MRAMTRGGMGIVMGLALLLSTGSAYADKISQSGIGAAPATATPATVDASGIDFGDDSSQWANDGECDDPRFTGTGAASELVDADLMKDATDCRAAYEAGTVTLAEDAPATADAPAATPTDIADIDFGDDTSEWANDDECDDPRFTGTGAASELVDADLMKDATDCRAAYEAGTVTLVSDAPATADTPAATPTDIADIDFGDDTSEWANDDECDDPRFTGTGSAAELVDADLMKDATDCRAAYEAGTVTLVSDAPASADTPVDIADIDFGDDTSDWAKDGECDDPRFSGTGVAETVLDADMGHDASDCRAAVEAGTATFGAAAPGDTPAQPAGFDYGNDDSRWANDGECDDLRFDGPGVDKKLLMEDMMADATDCKTLEANGAVWIRTVYTPDYAAGAPYDSSGVEFGENTSPYIDDGQCDDPRFEGPGTASTLLDTDRLADANDCRTAYEKGTVTLRVEETAD